MYHHQHFKVAYLAVALGLVTPPAIAADGLAGNEGIEGGGAVPTAQGEGGSVGTSSEGSMAANPTQMPKVVMARVGDVEITVEDFVRFLTRYPSKVRLARSAEGKAELLRIAIENRLLIAALVQEGLIDADMKPEMVQPAMVKLADRHFPLPPVPPEDQLKAFYAAHVEDFGIPAVIRISQILISVDNDAGQEAKESARLRAQRALERIKAGEAFGQVADEVSDRSDLRGRKGDIGFVNPRGHKWLGQAIAGLEVGQYTEVIESPSGFDILMLTDRREAVLTPFEQARDAVAKRMQEEARAKAKADYVKKLAASIPISIELDELKPYFANGWFP